MGASHRVRACGLMFLVPVAVLAAACGSGSSTTTTPTSASSSNLIQATTGPNATIDPQAPLTQTVDAAFDPPFTLRLPDDWTAVLRDISAFQAYAGNEDFEITFDHTYRSKESVEQAIARLTGTRGSRRGPSRPSPWAVWKARVSSPDRSLLSGSSTAGSIRTRRRRSKSWPSR